VIWSVLLVAALVVIVATARAGSALFWRTAGPPAGHAGPLDRQSVGAVATLLACVCGLVIWGGAATSFAGDTARQLADPSAYVSAVLGAGGGVQEQRRSLR
jgi:multicomponent K+:H+ antiporter subunit D